jgi:putative ABC transport system permease protein
LFLSLPLVYGFMVVLVKVLFMFYSGNFPLTIPMSRFALVILCGTISYALVAVLHLRRIRKVPFSLALKVQE